MVIRLFVDIQLLGYLFTLRESVILHLGEEDERVHRQICGGCHEESPQRFHDSKRRIDNGSAFTILGSKLQLVDTRGKVLRIPRHTVIDVYRTFDNFIVAVYEGRFYETRTAVQDEQKPQKEQVPEKQHWKPSSSHPWRRYVTARKQ